MTSFVSTNPATGKQIATYEGHSPAAIERLLAQAWDTHIAWSARSIRDRATVLEKIATLLEERADSYAQLITSEMGKLFVEARNEVLKAAGGARHFAGAGQAYISDEAIEGTPGKVRYSSLGPIFGVMPWNLPFWQVLRFFLPTALAGNVVLVKHADIVQGSARALEQLVLDADGPPGLYTNLAIRRDAVPGIIADKRIRAVTVTGSEAAGRAVAEAAGSHGKKAVLELGGSDPFIVFDDADFEKAVKIGIVSRFSNNAQSCIAAKRFVVSRKIFDDYVKAFAAAADALTVGDPMLAETRLGPLAKPDLVKTTQRQIADAQEAGGQVVTGGAHIGGGGNFFQPTVIVGLDPAAPIAQEEFFGPVALFFPFDTEEEAIRLANATSFGLGAAVWTSDPVKAERVADQIEAGAVFLNDFVRSDARAPFGGVKGSGFGRELGALGARELTNAKLIWAAA